MSRHKKGLLSELRVEYLIQGRKYKLKLALQRIVKGRVPPEHELYAVKMIEDMIEWSCPNGSLRKKPRFLEVMELFIKSPNFAPKVERYILNNFLDKKPPKI